MVTCRCGCEFENDRWTPFATCPKCHRSYPNESADMFHPKTLDELTWTCPSCGEVNEYCDGPSMLLRGSCASCGARKPGLPR